MSIFHFADHFLNRMQSAPNSAGTDDGDESSFRTRDIYGGARANWAVQRNLSMLTD